MAEDHSRPDLSSTAGIASELSRQRNTLGGLNPTGHRALGYLAEITQLRSQTPKFEVDSAVLSEVAARVTDIRDASPDGLLPSERPHEITSDSGYHQPSPAARAEQLDMETLN